MFDGTKVDAGINTDFKPTPYWWEDMPAAPEDNGVLPDTCDLVIIGSGYTGASAALAAATRGMSVLVLDSDSIGFGCSTRNGGQISTGIKPSLAKLTRKFGAERAQIIRRTGHVAIDHLNAVVEEHQIDCDWSLTGNYCAAHTPAAYEALAEEAEELRRDGEGDCEMVPRAEQHRYLGSDRYHGGMLTPFFGAVHPARLHAGLVARAHAAGARFVANCAVSAAERDVASVRVTAARGTIQAKNALIATNGYTPKAFGWFRRRIVPIVSNVLATDPIDPEQMDRLMPTRRTLFDSRNVMVYFRPSPDRTRLIFGGRAGLWELDPHRAAPRLYELMLSVFPDLAGIRISHCWGGTVAYSFDELPHIGERNGIYYSMGYCGQGVALSVYLGTKAGLKLAGDTQGGATPFDDRPYPTMPLYTGTPWFLAPSLLYYQIVDKYFS